MSTNIQTFRYSGAIFLWVAGILIFGIAAALWINWHYPSERTHLKTILIVLISLAAYMLFLAKAPVQKLIFTPQHVSFDEAELTEQQFPYAYYVNFTVWLFGSTREHTSMIVFRKNSVKPYLMTLFDFFFPASSNSRKVVFLSFWKDEEGTLITDQPMLHKILHRANQSQVRVTKHSWDRQIIALLIPFLLFVVGWILKRKGLIEML